jgi:hypothetical protein
MRLLASLLIAVTPLAAAGQDGPARKKNFTVSPETTRATGPLDTNGYVDYAAALNERLGKGVTADTNANVVIWKVLGPKPEGGNGMPAEFFRLMGIPEPPATGEYYVDLGKFAREQLAIDDPELLQEISEQTTVTMRAPWAAKDHPYVADWLKAVEKPLDLAAEGVKRPHYFNPSTPRKDKDGSASLISVLLPAVQKCRSMTNALTSRAMLRLHEGKVDEAWQDLLACYRLGRHLGRGATLIEGLVGIAIEAIAHRSTQALLERPGLTAGDFRRFARDLDALPPPPRAVDHVDLGERFMVLDLVMLADRKGLRDIVDALGFAGALPAGLANGRKLPAGRVENINWDPTLRAANRLFDRLAAALREPDRAKREAELDRIDADLQATKKELMESGDVDKALTGEGITPEARGKVFGDLLVVLMSPAVRKVQTAYDRNEQGRRNLHLAFALAAYQRDTGGYPKTLDALAPKYIDKVPGDLFTGKPLVYRPEGKGYLLYSFGVDGKDDGGRWYDDEPRGDDPNVRVPVPRPKR